MLHFPGEGVWLFGPKRRPFPFKYLYSPYYRSAKICHTWHRFPPSLYAAPSGTPCQIGLETRTTLGENLSIEGTARPPIKCKLYYDLWEILLTIKSHANISVNHGFISYTYFAIFFAPPTFCPGEEYNTMIDGAEQKKNKGSSGEVLKGDDPFLQQTNFLN